MESATTITDLITKNAELVRSTASREFGVAANYDIEGVRWLDGFINGQHLAASDEVKERLVQTLGSFLGECIRKTYGGEWVNDSGSWEIGFSQGNSAYPFTKVSKQLNNGAEDSVLGMFTAIPVLFFAQDAIDTPRRKPWWMFW
jgi:hypothetical protein